MILETQDDVEGRPTDFQINISSSRWLGLHRTYVRCI